MDAASTTASATTLTTGTLVLIAIGMLCAIAVIWWGTMLRRRRAAAVAEAEEHAALAGHPTEEASPDAPEQTGALPDPSPPEPAPIATAPVAIPESPGPSVGDLAPPPVEPSAPPPPPAPPAPAPTPTSLPLTMLKGLGPKAAAQLGTLGINSVDQLAALSAEEATALDARLGVFTGRLTRDRWVEQARLLSTGDRAGFEATFGKLGG